MNVNYKENSGFQLKKNDFHIFNLKDYKTILSELPTNIDIHNARFSGAMWYPKYNKYSIAVKASNRINYGY